MASLEAVQRAKGNEYWKLEIVHCGLTSATFGSEASLRSVLDEWINFSNVGTVERESMDPILIVRGFMDSFDRAPITSAYRMEEITGMSLYRMV